MTSRRRDYRNVVLTTPVTVPYARFSTRGAYWFIGQAVAGLLRDSGLAKDAIDGLCLASFTVLPDTAVGATQHLGLAPRWLDHVPMGGAAGVVSIRRAARAVQSGDADVVAVVGADTNHVDSFRASLGSFSQFARDATYPYGSGGPNAMFAFITANYLRQFGASREDFGRICVAQRENALATPWAMFRKPLTMAAYMDARVIADPIHLFDCVMPCAGAEAVLVMTEDRARDLGLPFVRLLAATERHNAYAADPIMTRGGWRVDRDDLYGQAGLTPADIDFVQFYDDYPVIVMMQFEDHGFCDKGEGPAFVASHRLTRDPIVADGSPGLATGAADPRPGLPVNTGGGQLSAGQAGAAGSMLGLTETVRQLTGRPLGSAVTGPRGSARHALVSGFGMVTYDRCLCTGALILARDDGAPMDSPPLARAA